MATPLPAVPAPRAGTGTARRLRREPTPSEDALWQLLRRASLGRKFRRQHTFGPFVLDFHCAAARLALEVDGAVHDSPTQREADNSRQEAIEQYQVTFLRVASREVEQHPEAVLSQIRAALLRREPCVDHGLLWVPASSLAVGTRVYCDAKIGSTDVTSLARGHAAKPFYRVRVGGNGLLVTEICAVRAA